MSASTSFDGILLKAVREGIVETLGVDSALALEFYLDSSIAVSNIAAYTASLKKIFGPGAAILEKKCAEKLYSKLGLEFEEKENYGLLRYVEDARRLSSTPSLS